VAYPAPALAHLASGTEVSTHANGGSLSAAAIALLMSGRTAVNEPAAQAVTLSMMNCGPRPAATVMFQFVVRNVTCTGETTTLRSNEAMNHCVGGGDPSASTALGAQMPGTWSGERLG
jgi:hypothetical protein